VLKKAGIKTLVSEKSKAQKMKAASHKTQATSCRKSVISSEHSKLPDVQRGEINQQRTITRPGFLPVKLVA
jgi:hypothetical protein